MRSGSGRDKGNNDGKKQESLFSQLKVNASRLLSPARSPKASSSSNSAAIFDLHSPIPQKPKPERERVDPKQSVDKNSMHFKLLQIARDGILSPNANPDDIKKALQNIPIDIILFEKLEVED